LDVPAVSMAIINDSKIVYHRSFGIKSKKTNEPVTPKDLFDACSLTKTLFSYWVLKEVDKGQLDLDRPLYQYLPYPDIEHDKRYKLITARMVLSHTSGFPNWRFFNEDRKLDIKFTPGTEFNYSGEGYEYLANVLAHINGIPKDSIEILMRKDVFSSLGMNGSGTVWDKRISKHRIDGHVKGKVDKGWGISPRKPGFYASYSLQSKAKDYAKLLIAIMEGQGLSKRIRDEMLTIQIDSKIKERKWGLGIEVLKTKNDQLVYKHGGFNNNFSSGYLFSKDTNNGFVFFSNSDTGYKLNDVFKDYFIESK
ncbi:MAG: serine hydrolase domain-containing protein, partial [Bacteroidota bacterium]